MNSTSINVHEVPPDSHLLEIANHHDFVRRSKVYPEIIVRASGALALAAKQLQGPDSDAN